MQDAFRRLADPSVESASPLSLDTLVPGRPALLDKVSFMIGDIHRLFMLCSHHVAPALSFKQHATAQGLGAINAVGKAAVHVANSLDNAVETLFEGWNASPPRAATSADSEVRQQVALLACAVPQSWYITGMTALAQQSKSICMQHSHRLCCAAEGRRHAP